MEGRYTIVILATGKNHDLVSKFRDKFSEIVSIPSVPPHVTLREDFFSIDIEGFIEEYRKKISGISPFVIEFTDIDLFQRGHIVYKVKRNPFLQKLHEITVEISQKYVSTPRVRTFDCALTEEQKILVEKYQLPFYFEYYTPHMTIVQLTNLNSREEVMDEIRREGLPEMFAANEVCIYDKLKHDVYKLVKL